MSHSILLFLLIFSFFFLCLLRVPIAYALGITSLWGLLQLDLSLHNMISHMLRMLDLFPLLAMPLFVLAGTIMTKSDITFRLIEVARALVGNLRGGLAYINVVVSMFFAGISGSSTADTSGIGSMLIPVMTSKGYPPNFSVAITAMSSTMGNIIPPSVYMVIYGAMGEVSIGALFLGGVIPGIMVGLSQMCVAYYMARRHNYPVEPPMTWGERLHVVRKAILALVIPVGLIGGIVFGYFTATEAAAVLVLYALFISLVVHKSLTLRQIPDVLGGVASFLAPALIIVCCASVFGFLIGYLRGPDLIAGKIETITTNPVAIILLLVLFLLILGTFLSEIVTIIIFIPIIQGLGDIANFHPVHLGVVVVMVLSLGLVTPPYGICLLLSASIGKVKVLSAFKECIIFVVMFLVIIGLVVILPGLTMWLPKLLMPKYL
ncbi:TRAP transporter large permease [Thermodesulfobacteriota bacterium]